MTIDTATPSRRSRHTFTAAHAGPCVECTTPFAAGESIARAKGGWAHAACPPNPAGSTTPELAELIQLFLDTDPDAYGWAYVYPDESIWESPDCDVMSARFLRLAQSQGFGGFLIRAESIDEGPHWFAVIEGHTLTQQVAVDWTAFSVDLPGRKEFNSKK